VPKSSVEQNQHPQHDFTALARLAEAKECGTGWPPGARAGQTQDRGCRLKIGRTRLNIDRTAQRGGSLSFGFRYSSRAHWLGWEGMVSLGYSPNDGPDQSFRAFEPSYSATRAGVVATACSKERLVAVVGEKRPSRSATGVLIVSAFGQKPSCENDPDRSRFRSRSLDYVAQRRVRLEGSLQPHQRRPVCGPRRHARPRACRSISRSSLPAHGHCGAIRRD
jgi:hypothetical protein